MKQVQRAGASGFLAKNEAPARLVEAVEMVLAGAPFFASESACRPSSQLNEQERVPVQYLLTQREIDVLRQLALGLGNKEAAAALDMSVRTIETHRASIMVKLSADSLGEMVKLAIQDGVV
jgi:DNA-binding NarL/FixJ family response regulator